VAVALAKQLRMGGYLPRHLRQASHWCYGTLHGLLPALQSAKGREPLIGDRCPRCSRTDATRLSAQTALRVDFKCRFCALEFSISSSDMPAVVQGDPCRL
jgi:hypothetical protein